MTEQKSIDEVYHDRNLLALAFCELWRIRTAQLQALPGADWVAPGAGWSAPDDADDADADEWAIVWANLPTGQVSWHVPRSLVEESLLRRLPHNYDGHSPTEKNDRLEAFANPD